MHYKIAVQNMVEKKNKMKFDIKRKTDQYKYFLKIQNKII